MDFYNNRAVGKNHATFSRHLGKLIRNRNVCPLKVKSWVEIKEDQKDHMWDSVVVIFMLITCFLFILIGLFIFINCT